MTFVSGLFAAPIEIDEDLVIYAVGDVHGCIDLLSELEESIICHHRYGGKRGLLIRLGDYIDRGRNSLKVLQRLAKGLREPRLTEINLMGNHDHMLAAVIAGTMPLETTIPLWLWNGGDAALESMGIGAEPVDIDALASAIKKAIGEDALDCVMGLRTHHREGNLVFVHAGINPGWDLNTFLSRDWRDISQIEEDATPLWIRRPFLTHAGPFQDNVIVVHGHTITREPGFVNGNRISLDTGAYRSGVLTCAEIQRGGFRLICTGDALAEARAAA